MDTLLRSIPLRSAYFESKGLMNISGLGDIATIWDRGPVRALRSMTYFAEDSKWLHLSVSCQSRHPTWEEMVRTKMELMIKNQDAIMVLPVLSDHVNLHRHCFHWWQWLAGPTHPFPNLQKIVLESAL